MSFYQPPYIVKSGQKNDYIINNSFHCGLQPKRVSNDAQLYMLYHKKMLRKAVIARRFEQNLNSFYRSSEPQKAGFKGTTTRVHFSQSKSSSQRYQKQFRIKKKGASCHFEIDEYPNNRLVEQRKLWIPNQNANYRPNMMKSFRKNEGKSNNICIKIVEDYKKIMSQSTDAEEEKRRRVKTLM